MGYTMHANGSVSYNSDDETQLFVMIREKAERVLSVYKDFVYPTSKIYMLRSASKYAAYGLEHGQFMAYSDPNNGCIYLVASKMLRLSDAEVYDTVLHEIAHVVHEKIHRDKISLWKIDEMHGVEWYMIYLKMGGSGIIDCRGMKLPMVYPLYTDVENPEKFVHICTNSGPDGKCYDHTLNIDHMWLHRHWIPGSKLTPDGRIITRRRCTKHNMRYELMVPESFYRAHPHDDIRDNIPLEYLVSVCKQIAAYEASKTQANERRDEPDEYEVIKLCTNTGSDGRCFGHHSVHEIIRIKYCLSDAKVDASSGAVILGGDLCIDHNKPFELIVPHAFRKTQQGDNDVPKKYLKSITDRLVHNSEEEEDGST